MAEKMESSPLLEGEVLLAPRTKKGVFLSYRLGAAVGLCWLASLGYVARTKTDVLELAASDDDERHYGSVKADPGELSMMKRTHLSINAIKGGEWLQDKIGFGHATSEYWVNSSGFSTLSKYAGDKHENSEQEALKGHGHDDMDICAARTIFGWVDESATNMYNWHEFQGSNTPTGPLGPEYWWDLIYKYNTETASYEGTDDVWSAFLHMGQHMYVQDLSKHMAKFAADGTPHLARHYKAVAPGDEGRTVYVVFVANPYNGNAVIIHAKDVSNDALNAKFTELESSACPFAVALPYDIARLDQWWDSLYVHTADEQSLPKPMPVMDSHPTFDVDEVAAYFDEKIKIHRFGATTALHDKTEGSTSVCKVFTISLGTQFQTAFEARFVYTPSARNFDEVGRYHKYVDAEVRSTTAINSGYSRWMDEHWAFMLKDTHTLDQLRFTLEDSETPYHAHVTEVVGNDVVAGSLWAWGVSGIGIEWHGGFDYTTFEKPIGGFDFCTADTTCQPQDTTCLEVSNVTGVTRNAVAGATAVNGAFDPDGANGGNTGGAGGSGKVLGGSGSVGPSPA